MTNDREQIVDLMVTYGRGIDRRDWALLESCFDPAVVVRYHGFGEPLDGYHALEEYLRRALGPLDATQHLFTNFLVETDGVRGGFSCSLQAQHVQGTELFTVGGSYECRVARVDAGWQITELDFSPIWTAGNPAVLAHLTG